MSRNKKNAVTLNFNLREPRGNKQTQLYAVIKMNGKQYKQPIGCEINPWQWNRKTQTPTFEYNMTAEERENAQKVFNTLYAVKLAWTEYISYLCSVSQPMRLNELKEQVFGSITNNKSMAKKSVKVTKGIVKATDLLQMAVDMYTQLHSVEQSTVEAYRTKLKMFGAFCEQKKKDSISMLTDDGIKEFEIYIREQKCSENNIRDYIKVIKILVNNCITKHPKLNIYGVRKLNIELPKGRRTEGKKFTLNMEEIQAIKNCDGLTPKQMEYRDLFLLEIYTGQRASDLHRLLEKEYTEEKGYAIYYNKKKKQNTVIKLTADVQEIIERYRDGLKFVDIKAQKFSSNFTSAVKKIAHQAGLTKNIRYIQDGVEKEKPQYELISSHIGRHTFITDKIKDGMSANDVSYLSGHKGTQTINSTYTHLTTEDKIEILSKQQKEKETDLIKETKDVLMFLGADYSEIRDIDNIDELMRMLYVEHELPIRQMGMSVEKIKALYNSETPFKKKQETLAQWIAELKEKKAEKAI